MWVGSSCSAVLGGASRRAGSLALREDDTLLLGPLRGVCSISGDASSGRLRYYWHQQSLFPGWSAGAAGFTVRRLRSKREEGYSRLLQQRGEGAARLAQQLGSSCRSLAGARRRRQELASAAGTCGSNLKTYL